MCSAVSVEGTNPSTALVFFLLLVVVLGLRGHVMLLPVCVFYCAPHRSSVLWLTYANPPLQCKLQRAEVYTSMFCTMDSSWSKLQRQCEYRPCVCLPRHWRSWVRNRTARARRTCTPCSEVRVTHRRSDGAPPRVHTHAVCAECVRVCVPSRLTLCVFDSPATLPPAEPPQFTSSTTNGMRFKVGNMTPALTVCGGCGREGRLCVGIVLGAGVGG